MKILLISNMYPSSANASYGVFVRNFEEDMLKRGVTFRKAIIKGKGKNTFDKLKKYFRFFLDIYTLVYKKDINLIYVHYISHSLLPLFPIAPFLKKPLVINAHGGDLLPKKLLSRMILAINYYTIKNSSMIVVPSEFFRNIIVDKYNHSNVIISPSGGVDSSLFYLRKNKCFDPLALVLGYVSRIDEGKGWGIFLNSLVILRGANPELNIKAVMVGGGAQEFLVQDVIKNLGLELIVSYLGPKPQNELPEILNNIDLFVFPTMLAESLGLVGLESMACGTPVAGSRVGGLTSYIDDGVNGFLFDPGDAEQLASVYSKYNALDEVEKRRISSNAIESAKLYDKDIVGEKLSKKLYSL